MAGIDSIIEKTGKALDIGLEVLVQYYVDYEGWFTDKSAEVTLDNYKELIKQYQFNNEIRFIISLDDKE